jgi:hypothetical protein
MGIRARGIEIERLIQQLRIVRPIRGVSRRTSVRRQQKRE